MDVILTIGTEGPFLDSSRQLNQMPGQIGGGHALHVWGERAHNSRCRRKMIPLYI